MEKSKVQEMFSIISKYKEGHVTLSLVFGEENILLNQFVKSAKNEQEAKLMHEAYRRLMLEKEYALYFAVQYMAKAFEIEYKGKNINDVVKLINQKVKELEGVIIV